MYMYLQSKVKVNKGHKKFLGMFDQNPYCTFDKIREKPIPIKNALTA